MPLSSLITAKNLKLFIFVLLAVPANDECKNGIIKNVNSELNDNCTAYG